MIPFAFSIGIYLASLSPGLFFSFLDAGFRINDLRYEAVEVVTLTELDDVRSKFLRTRWELREFRQSNPTMLWLRIYMSSKTGLHKRTNGFPHYDTFYWLGADFPAAGKCNEWAGCSTEILVGAGTAGAVPLPQALAVRRDPRRTYYYTYVAVSRPRWPGSCTSAGVCTGYDLSVTPQSFSLMLDHRAGPYFVTSNYITVLAEDIASAIRDYRHPPRRDDK
jgi:hypothetical protein